MYGNQEFQQFLEDSVSENEATSMEAWLDQDPERWKRVEELADDQELVTRLRNSLPAVIYQDEPEFQRAMAEASTAVQSESLTVSQTISVAAEVGDTDDVSLEGYRVIRQLGRGGMGAVYEAEHELMKKRVAIKVMSPRFLQDSTAVERFMSEMVAIGKLNHLNLVRGLDARRENGRLFLIMEYLEAEDLAAYQIRRGPLPLHECCDIVRQAALGLAHAHEQGIIHRDIKPLNLMITSEGVVKVLDLGLARLESVQATTHLTNDRTIVGSPDYISPEQVQTPRDVDARADIYSLGCTLFFLLTGRSPFHHYSEALSKLMAHVNEAPVLPAKIRKRIPETLVQVLNGMMEKDRNVRFQSAQDLVEAIAPFCEPTGSVRSIGTESNLSKTVEAESFAATHSQPPTEPQNFAIPKAIRQWHSNWRMVALGAAVPLLLVVAFGITLSIKTQEGTIQLQLADGSQLAAINVDKDQTITIQDPDDKKTIEITVDREKRMLRLHKEGFEVLTRDFQVDVNGQKIQVAFIPQAAAAKALPGSTASTEAPDANGLAIRNQIAIADRGVWLVDGDEIAQTTLGRKGQVLTFGDVAWTDYDFSFEGRVPNQPRVHGFSGLFHFKTPVDCVSFGVGLYYNKGHDVTRLVEGKWHRMDDMYTDGSIEAERWHSVRIKVRGATAHCYLDDQLLFVSKEPLFESGKCGLATFDTRARFRNLRVVTPDGEILWEGVPTSIKDASSL